MNSTAVGKINVKADMKKRRFLEFQVLEGQKAGWTDRGGSCQTSLPGCTGAWELPAAGGIGGAMTVGTVLYVCSIISNLKCCTGRFPSS